jgi:hypothetical protein
MRRRAVLVALLVAVPLAACAPRQRSGMVVDPATGLQYGSTVERNLVVDASQFDDPRLKLRIRNTSGDPVFDLAAFRDALESAYQARGYVTASGAAGDTYGVLLDINVVYSGQLSQSMAAEYGFLGLAAGGIGGSYAGTRGAAAGAVSGAALGAILGSYVTEDTYIVVAEVTLAVADARSGRIERVIQFGVDDDAEDSTGDFGRRRFDEQLRTGVAVYAGGRSIAQAAIAEEVRQRLRRILADVI